MVPKEFSQLEECRRGVRTLSSPATIHVTASCRGCHPTSAGYVNQSHHLNEVPSSLLGWAWCPQPWMGCRVFSSVSIGPEVPVQIPLKRLLDVSPAEALDVGRTGPWLWKQRQQVVLGDGNLGCFRLLLTPSLPQYLVVSDFLSWLYFLMSDDVKIEQNGRLSSTFKLLIIV